jgi:putative hemolysin
MSVVGDESGTPACRSVDLWDTVVRVTLPARDTTVSGEVPLPRAEQIAVTPLLKEKTRNS